MEEKNKAETILEHVNHYFETRWKLFVLNASDKASDAISSIASILLIGLLMIFVLLFLSISTALWIGNSYGSMSFGFLMIGLFYLAVTLVLFYFRNTFIKIPIINKLLNAIYNEKED